MKKYGIIGVIVLAVLALGWFVISPATQDKPEHHSMDQSVGHEAHEHGSMEHQGEDHSEGHEAVDHENCDHQFTGVCKTCSGCDAHENGKSSEHDPSSHHETGDHKGHEQCEHYK